MEENKISTSGFMVQPRLQFRNNKDKMLYRFLFDEANYVPTESCEIGQHITSVTSLQEDTGWSYGVVRGILKRLEDDGYITVETRSQKRGIKVTITDYTYFQNLENYKKANKENNKPLTKRKQTINKEEKPENPCESKVKPLTENVINKEETKEEQTDNKEIHNAITAFITSINNNNINKTLKEYISDAPVKNKNLSTADEIETFVDFALRTNSLPTGVSKKILISYFDCIRLTRQTCTISANILANLIDKMSKYSVDQLHYALWTHYEKHDDKPEKYTLGILRNTDIHEAKRGLMKLKNKGVATYAKHSSYPAAVGESTASTSKEVERLEAIARERGLYGQIRDVELDF